MGAHEEEGEEIRRVVQLSDACLAYETIIPLAESRFNFVASFRTCDFMNQRLHSNVISHYQRRVLVML